MNTALNTFTTKYCKKILDIFLKRNKQENRFGGVVVFLSDPISLHACLF